MSVETDVLIVGGGIAGLWLNAALRAQGYSTLLLEHSTLGGLQTLHSQGIIHGGIKYTLQGGLSGASEAIAGMPERWRACLAGAGDLDLSGVGVLSEAHYLWSPGGLLSGLSGFLASKAVRGRVDRLADQQDLPAPLQHPQFRGRAYRLAEWVLDVPSLVRRLATLGAGSLRACQRIEAVSDTELAVDGQCVRAQRILFCAGAGNAELAADLGLGVPQQERPLHMVLAWGAGLQPFYAHCLGAGSRPRFTITSHPCQGGWAWYLGGELAEASGVARTATQQIDVARSELREALPWVDQSRLSFRTFRINRAEGAQPGMSRPDGVFLAERGASLVAWPTKLALVPDLSDRVLAALRRDEVMPRAAQVTLTGAVPDVGLAPWEQVDAESA